MFRQEAEQEAAAGEAEAAAAATAGEDVSGQVLTIEDCVATQSPNYTEEF